MALAYDIWLSIWQSIGVVLYYTWWFWLAILLWPFFEGTWLFWKREEYKHELGFMFFELRMPRAIVKSPAAMEQIFIAISALKNAPGDFSEYWLEGEVTRWYSIEILSLGGEIHFYLRVPRIQGEIIKAAFFSYYPDLEIVEVDDYVSKSFPKNTEEMFKNGYDMWGSELVYVRDDVYPIKSYLDFESPEEEKQYDPMSLMLEILGRTKREEIVGIQINFFPIGDHLREHSEHVIEKLRTKKKQHAPSAAMTMEFPHILPVFPVAGKEGAPENEFARALSRTPGETDILKAIEENLALPMFETNIRFVYFSPKEIYSDTFARRGLAGAFKQYDSMDLNSFKRNDKMSTRARIWNWPYVFSDARVRVRKDRLIMAYAHREIAPTTEMGKLLMSKLLNWEHSREMIMSARSLATIFHPPTHMTLTAPHMKRVESRKAGAPAGLPIYGNEEEIEKYR
jgi:hypothetical protein